MQTDWDDYFLKLATHVASKSKDPSTKVGCVMVGPDREIRSTGYNGFPRGVHDYIKLYPERYERPAKYLWTSHAEENAVAQAARIGARLKGCIAYVTHMPCARCTRAMIQAGIDQIVYDVDCGLTSLPPEEFRVAQAMQHEAGVTIKARRIMEKVQ